MARASCKITRSSIAAAALALLAATPASAQPSSVRASPDSNSAATAVSDAALRFGIPEHWIYAVMRAESAGRVNATSPVGAQGLMQIMPATWAVLRARYGLGANAYDPRDNIMAGAAYIREMYDQFGAPGFLGAYNAGPGRYGDYVTKGRSLPAETRAYIAKIAPAIASGTQAPNSLASSRAALPVQPSWTHSALFALRADRSPLDSAGAAELPSPVRATLYHAPGNASPNGLFVQISARISQ
jgi:soluble lytic murein transglycosylase-like protein